MAKSGWGREARNTCATPTAGVASVTTTAQTRTGASRRIPAHLAHIARPLPAEIRRFLDGRPGAGGKRFSYERAPRRRAGLSRGERAGSLFLARGSASRELPRRRRASTSIDASRTPIEMITEIDILWITAGPGCDGDTIAMTAATQPSL